MRDPQTVSKGRERLACSPNTQLADVGGGANTVVLQMSQAGTVDLDRLLIGAMSTDPVANQSTIDLTPLVRVGSIRLRNTVELIRGDSSSASPVQAPGGVFNPLRSYTPVRLGKVHLEARETIAINLHLNAAGVTAVGSFAVPYVPDEPYQIGVGEANLAGREHSYAGATLETIAPPPAAQTADVTISFDGNGVADLSSLQILASADPTADFKQDVVAGLQVQSILIPGRNELITGVDGGAGAELAVPGPVFSAFGRRNSWVDFGPVGVTQSNTVVVKIHNRTDLSGPPAINTQVTVGMRFYPEGPSGTSCRG